MPDNLRIELTKERLSPDLLVAFNTFEQMEVARECYDTALEDDFAAFSVAVIRVGVSLVRRQSQQDAQGPAAAAPAAAGLVASDERAKQLRYTQGDNSCWKWSVGECSHGDNCRFEHVGEAGSQRSTVVDENDQCLMHMRRGQCTRKNCPFGHDGNKAAAAAEDKQQTPPHAPPAPPAPPAIRQDGDPACYSSAARAAAERGRTQFSVLHEDKAGRSREHKVSSEEFFAPGSRTASGGLKPRWIQNTQEDDSDCEDY